MANLPRIWSSPLRDLDQLRSDFDELFDRVLGGTHPHETGATAIHGPALESFIENGDVVIRADLPGIDPKDVEVQVTGNSLTIRGKRESTQETKGRNYFHREVAYGVFERTVQLPGGIKGDDVKASYRNGVLELRAPMPKEQVARKVPIEFEGAAAAKAKS